MQTNIWKLVLAFVSIVVQLLPFIQRANSSIMLQLGAYGLLDDAKKTQLFHQFVRDYNKSYDSNEHDQRFKIFKNNLITIDERNHNEKLAGGTAIHAVNRFSDLSLNECKRYLLGIDFVQESVDMQKLITENMKSSKSKLVEEAADIQYISNLTYVNWTGTYTTPIKDQGDCGSCWAFAVVEQTESDAIRLNGWNKNFYLSSQQLVDCVTANDGCNGGSMLNTYSYVKNYGLEFDVDYPYVGISGNCTNIVRYVEVKISGFTFMNYNYPTKYNSTEISMANYVLTTGPLAIHVDGTAWLTYSSGILASCTKNINHVAQIVGVDLKNKFWIVRNSWGTSWGEGGYIRLQYMTNQCNLASYPSFVSPYVLHLNTTMRPSREPTTKPSRSPSVKPSYKPTTEPSMKPSSPTMTPTRKPTRTPSSKPSRPTNQPTRKPTGAM